MTDFPVGDEGQMERDMEREDQMAEALRQSEAPTQPLKVRQARRDLTSEVVDPAGRVVDLKALRFLSGGLVATPGALEAFARNNMNNWGWTDLLYRHFGGDWGEVDEHDRRENEYGLIHGFRLMSVYSLKDGTKVWAITEADRSVTTFLLPEEY